MLLQVSNCSLWETMKKIKPICIFTLCLLFSSCHDNLNKSILEPLTVEELKSEMEKDSDFISFYEDFQRIREKRLDTEVAQAKYGELTYRRIWDIFKFIQAPSTYEEIQEEAQNRYKAQKKDYAKSLDSLSITWKEKASIYDPTSYVKIEFASIDREYYSNSTVLKAVNIGFRITPLKGIVEQVKFSYRIQSKISEGQYSYWDNNCGNCICSQPLYNTEVCYWELPYSLRDALEYKTTYEVIRDYDIRINVSRVRYNGENIDANDFSIPYEISEYIKNPKDEYYRDRVIQDHIDENYKTMDELARIIEREMLKKKDSEVLDFLDYIEN